VHFAEKTDLTVSKLIILILGEAALSLQISECFVHHAIEIDIGVTETDTRGNPRDASPSTNGGHVRMIMLMTVLPARPDYYILAHVSKKWVTLIKANKQTELSFVFSLPSGIVDIVKQTLPVPVRERARFLPVPHETLIKMFSQLRLSWGASRFLEISLYRNMLLEYARAGQPEMAIFLDADVVPPDDAFRIFQEKPFEVLGGIVRTFNNEWNEIIGAGTFRTPFFTGLDWIYKLPTTRIQVDFVNTACMALSPSVEG